MSSTRIIGALALGLAATTAACDDMGVDARDTEPVSLSFAASFGTGLAGAAHLAAPPIGDGTNTVELSALSITFDEVVLERSEDETDGDSDGESDGIGGDSDSEADSDSDGASNEDFGSGSVTIDIPVEGTVVTELSIPVPVGRYEELELDIASVRLVGTRNDESFDVTVPLDLELETEFDPAIDVADALNLTVTIDLDAWLREPDGSVIDPSALATDANLRSRLMQRIALSLDAFEDSDRDGDDSDSDSDLAEDDDG